MQPIVEFLRLEAASGILLVACALTALIWANSIYASSYTELWATQVVVAVGSFEISKPLLLWINDGLMAVFFFLVGLEIKREILVGELSDLKSASLPIAAAIGGMVVPAGVYAMLNAGGPGVRGWGVPMATDIAFALGVLALIGSRVPLALKIFLAAFAIVDDIGAVLVIALFYTSQIYWAYLAVAGVILVGLILLNLSGARAPVGYTILGVALWVCFLKSGVHATVAGVLFAMTIPARTRMNPDLFVERGRELLKRFDAAGEHGPQVVLNEDRQQVVHRLERSCQDIQMPVERIENTLHPYVTLGIVPIFALANAGVQLSGPPMELMTSPITLGVILGLIIGKPIGITFFSWLAVKIGLAVLPEGVGWRQVFGVGILGGIGFTMSLFIAELAFIDMEHLTEAKFGILMASLIAGVVGFLLLKKVPRHRVKPKLGL